MSNFIGVSEQRLKHILSVARTAYSISKSHGYDESFCRKMFFLGWIHDIGYEFSEKQEEHSYISADILLSAFLSCAGSKEEIAVRLHGLYNDSSSEEWKILNAADMQVDSNGSICDVNQRLEEIKKNYGEYSNQYLTACDICYNIGLTAINFARNTI